MIGVVIGSFGMPSAVALNVAAIRNFNKTRIPILVHDDFTQNDRDPDGYLLNVNEEFELIKSERQLGHIAGDIRCFIRGLKWARRMGLKYLVKLSQRFIFTSNEWCASAVVYAERENVITASQIAYSNAAAPWGSGSTRTECVMFRVDDWARDAVYEALEGYHATPELSVRNVAESVVHPERKVDRWRAFGPDKSKKRVGVLWHDANGEGEYRALAETLGCKFGWYTNLGWPTLLGHSYKMS